MSRFFVLCIYVFMSVTVFASKIGLSGKWGVRLDSLDVGVKESWQKEVYVDSIVFPGALHTQGYGFDVTSRTKWYSGNLSAVWHYLPLYEKYGVPGNIKIFDFLQPEKYYIGIAWYKRTIDVPADTDNKEYFIYLERVHWESTLYINNKKVGSNLGLGTPHEYNITDFVQAGKNEFVVRVDNSPVVDLGRTPHSLSEQTMAAWNGIIGDMELRVKDKIWIDDVQIFPDFEKKQAVVKLKVGNKLNRSTKINLRIAAENYNSRHSYPEKEILAERTVPADPMVTIELVYPFSKKVQTWDEFNPSLYMLRVVLNSSLAVDEMSISFGFRDLKLNGRRFELNGRTVSIRGNLNCGEFPIDGLPEMGVSWWKNIFRIHKEWGHNMARFHSWCPPKAAFIAADEVGIYLQPEAGEWGVIVSTEQEQFIRDESNRMIRYYGNHPSWVFFAMGNELRCDPAIMTRFIEQNKPDGRRFVTGKTNGRPFLDSFDFTVSHSINNKRIRHHLGWPPQPETNLLFHIKPNTAYDYSEPISESPKPFLAHEIGQYCVFPDYQHEVPKYTGSLKATVLEIQKDQLEERGMGDQASLFSEATGRWQIALLKSEYEAILRTPQMAGFHALSLQDFPGQSHAPVGVLDQFWERKEHITPAEFREFCNETVLLARIPDLILQQKDTFRAAIELYNFAEKPVSKKYIGYEITDEANKVILNGRFQKKDYPDQRSNLPVGTLSLSLQEIKAPAKYTLRVGIEGTSMENRWSFWVFPTEILTSNQGIKVVKAFDEQTMQFLEAGENVLWLTDQSKLKGNLPTCFASIYWTGFGLNDGESMCNSILCDPNHPLFRYFPTGIHTNWQWWDVLKYSVPVILDEYGATRVFPKSYKPVLQVIDSWKVNRKLALLAECRYAKGKLMISGIDFSTDMENRVASRQLYASLISYMRSDDFNPETHLDQKTILSVYGNPENNLLNIGAQVTSSNNNSAARDQWMMDGDENTVWVADKSSDMCGTVTIDLKREVLVKGLSITSSENGIRNFTYSYGEDRINWTPAVNINYLNSHNKHIVLFNNSVSTRYIRITYNGFLPSIAELDFIYADVLPTEG